MHANSDILHEKLKTFFGYDSFKGDQEEIISQLIAGTAVIAVVAPGLGLLPALLITAAFMALYVIGGGIRGAGVVGILKLALLYVSMICCGILALHLSGGLPGGAGGQRTVRIAVMNGWDEGVAASWLWKEQLEEHGYAWIAGRQAPEAVA